MQAPAAARPGPKATRLASSRMAAVATRTTTVGEVGDVTMPIDRASAGQPMRPTTRPTGMPMTTAAAPSAVACQATAARTCPPVTPRVRRIATVRRDRRTDATSVRAITPPASAATAPARSHGTTAIRRRLARPVWMVGSTTLSVLRPHLGHRGVGAEADDELLAVRRLVELAHPVRRQQGAVTGLGRERVVEHGLADDLGLDLDHPCIVGRHGVGRQRDPVADRLAEPAHGGPAEGDLARTDRLTTGRDDWRDALALELIEGVQVVDPTVDPGGEAELAGDRREAVVGTESGGQRLLLLVVHRTLDGGVPRHAVALRVVERRAQAGHQHAGSDDHGERGRLPAVTARPVDRAPLRPGKANPSPMATGIGIPVAPARVSMPERVRAGRDRGRAVPPGR